MEMSLQGLLIGGTKKIQSQFNLEYLSNSCGPFGIKFNSSYLLES